VCKGWAGLSLLSTYDFERRPISLFNLEMVEKGTAEFMMMMFAIIESGKEVFAEESEDGEKKRAEFSSNVQKAYWLHHQDGVTLGKRYEKSPVIVHDHEDSNGYEKEEEWDVEHYKPSTMPGGRPPHVWLKNGQTSVFDLLSAAFNVVDFTEDGQVASTFAKAAKGMGLPLKMIHLPDEEHVRKMWQRDAVLVRPDGIVGWRLPARMGRKGTVEPKEAMDVLRILSNR
jgi:hypothetical protein